MLTRTELRRARLRSLVREPRRSWPDLRQHLRGRIAMGMGRVQGLLRKLDRSGWAPPPGIVYYAINTPCNLTCYSCDAGTGEKSFIMENLAKSSRPRLSLEEFRGVLRSLRRVKPEVFISAMEPLLTPDTPEHVRAVAASGMRCTINTNGLLLAGKAEALVDAGLHQLFVSLDGPTPAINDPIRGAGAFERTLAGIRAVAAAKEARRSHWPEIVLCATMSERNTGDLVGMAELARTLPIQGLVFQHLWWVSEDMAAAHNARFPDYPVSAARSGTRPLEVDLDLLKAQIAAVRERLSGFPVSFAPELRDAELETYYRRHLEKVRDVRCPVMWQGVQIVPNGDVMVTYVCPTHTFGNVRSTPLLEVWNGTEARAFRARMSEELAPRCTRCHDIYAA